MSCIKLLQDCKGCWDVRRNGETRLYPSKDRGYDNLSVFTGVGLGAIAAVAVVIFLLIGALMKVVLGTWSGVFGLVSCG